MNMLVAIPFLSGKDPSAQRRRPTVGLGSGSACLGPAAENAEESWGASLRVLAVSCLCTCHCLCLHDPESVLVGQKSFFCSFAGLRAASPLGCSIQSLGGPCGC